MISNDIHDHFWICMDMDMVDIHMDIQNGYPCWTSMSILDIQHGYPFWICMDVDMADIQKDIQKIHIHIGYPCLLWISNMDIHIEYPCLLWISNMDMYFGYP